MQGNDMSWIQNDIEIRLSIEELGKLVQMAKAAQAQRGGVAKNITLTVRPNKPEYVQPDKFDANKVINGQAFTKFSTHRIIKNIKGQDTINVGFGSQLIMQGGITTATVNTGMAAPQPAAPANAQPATEPQPLSPEQQAYPAHPGQATPAPQDVNPFENDSSTDDFAGW